MFTQCDVHTVVDIPPMVLCYFPQIASGDSHPIKYNVLEIVVKTVARDGGKFAAAHAALEDMLEDIVEEEPEAKVPRTSSTTRATKPPKRDPAAPKTQPDLPLLLFVVPDYKYHAWDRPQAITVRVRMRLMSS